MEAEELDFKRRELALNTALKKTLFYATGIYSNQNYSYKDLYELIGEAIKIEDYLGGKWKGTDAYEREKIPEGLKLVDNFINANKGNGDCLIWNVTNEELKQIENSGIEFIIEKYWGEYFSNLEGAVHVFRKKGKNILLKLWDNKE
jgi:hypothetical protein